MSCAAAREVPALRHGPAMNFKARIYVQMLKLNQHVRRHSIPCVFHPDSQPSLSIDLDKAMHYCHGGCAPPKGGGPLVFIMKWAKYVEKKPILSKSEARSRLRRSLGILPSVKDLQREQLREEVMLFADYALQRFAEYARLIQHALDDINAYCADYPKAQNDDEIWDMLARLHSELAWCDEALAACPTAAVTFDFADLRDAPMIPVLIECKRRGWWTPKTKLHAEMLLDFHQRESALARQWEALCPENPSPIPRTPIPRRMPVQ